MKLSRRTLLKLKNKNKKLKPNKYRKLKREALRGNIKGTVDRPRLSVYRSNENIYAQIIDDTTSKTLLTWLSQFCPRRGPIFSLTHGFLEATVGGGGEIRGENGSNIG